MPKPNAHGKDDYDAFIAQQQLLLQSIALSNQQKNETANQSNNGYSTHQHQSYGNYRGRRGRGGYQNRYEHHDYRGRGRGRSRGRNYYNQEYNHRNYNYNDDN